MKIKNTITILLLLLSSFAFAQEKVLIDAKTKKEVVNKVAKIMQEKYVFADIGEKMAKHILQLDKKCAYDSFSEVKPFCTKLTSDLREISNDKHIFVFYSPEETYQVKAFKKNLPEEEIKKINDLSFENDRRKNFGFRKVEILDGNIGYLDLQYFASADIFEEKLIGVMNFLSNTNAVIIDLRENGGGQGSSLFPSYFFPPEKIDLGCAFCRDTTLNSHSWTQLNIPGKRLPDIELYILTSLKTFSAAEGFAYTMQSLKRAVLVGETTKGGAHPIDVLIVKGDILTQFSICDSYNPITKSNWEGTGVKPDIKVKSEDALNTAYITALEHIIEKTSDIEYKKELELLLNKFKN
jgi:retinol-binding protein 3